jgi:hypothetical protein
MAKEKEEEITITKSDLKEALDELNKEYKDKLDAANSKIEELRATLEMQDAKQSILKPNTQPEGAPKLEVIGNFNPIDHQGMLAKPYKEKNPDQYYRYINSKPDEASLRLAQGFKTVRDEKGNEVRYYDSVLASMPKRQFEETIAKPIQDLKKHRRGSAETQFHETGDALGVKTFGEVTYDKGE